MVVVADGFAALLGTGQWQMPSAYHHSLTFRCSTVSTSTASSLKQMGRPRKVGKRLPGLKALVPPWQTVEMKDWYGRGDYPSAPQFGTKLGMPAVPIRWVLIKDPKGSLNPKRSYART